MGNKLYEENSVQAIANAIRSKLGVETTYKINEMAGAINTIVKPSGTTNITENGYHNVTAYEQAYVQVPGSVPTGTVNIVENGDYDVGQYAEAHVAVPQPVGKKIITQNGTDIDIAQYAVADVIVQPNVGTKTINQNGVYNASSDNLDGYSQVTVNGFTPSYIKNPIEFDYNIGYVNYNSTSKTGTWTYQNPSANYSDIYTVEQGKTYRICTGEDYGDRFRGVVTETDIRTITSGYIEGLQFVGLGSVPSGSTLSQFTASVTGYLVIQKSASNEDQILTYLMCVDDMNTDEPSGTKTITENGDGIDVAGYSAVDVNVPPPAYIKIPIEFDYTNGYVDTNGIWTYQYPSNNYLDIYSVENGKSYKLMFGAVTGNRARGCLTTTDVRTLPEGSTVSGTFVGTNATTIVPGTWYPFTSAIDGYLIMQKCNDQQANIQTYLFCVEDM